MHGNGERDPLDGWLGQQVQPLPPPPGTFELITRRARRRKIRKLAVTVASAAAVAAGVAVAVPNVLALKLTPTQIAASQAGRQSATTSGGGTSSTNGSASPAASPTTSTPSPVNTGPAKPMGPVPPNFQPSSVTFDSTQVGWVIGQAGTPGKCANVDPYVCTSIVRTDDAGQTWHGGPAPKTGAPAGPTGVSGIRFLDGTNGWAFGPELWVTHDKGNTWQQLDTQGQRVTDLETVNGRAYALWATCTGTNAASFALNCTSYTLMTSTAGSDAWQAVGGQTDDMTAAGNVTSGFIALTGSVGYLVAPDGTMFAGPIGGIWSRQGTVRCQPGAPQITGLPGRALFAAADPVHLAMACAGTSSSSPATIYTSANGGAFWTANPAPGLPGSGAITSLTAALNGTLVLATSNGLYVLAHGGTRWEQAQLQGGAPGGGFSYVGMTTDSQGVAVPANTGLHEIWMTYDGGQTWQPKAIA